MVKTAKQVESSLSSAGHKLGQLVGDWWETQVIYPLLTDVATALNLYLDCRVVSRSCRSEKIQWADSSGNFVDYDYVIEMGGSESSKGIPVAFLESFWRRGARHSKDKARDDTNKLLPMRDAYPTARFLAIAACGEFTEPARDYVRSRNVELFFIGKDKIIEAFNSIGLNIDYPDSLPEDKKMTLVRKFEENFTLKNQEAAATNLKALAGHGAFLSFKQRIFSALTATPQEIRIFAVTRCGPIIFNSINSVQEFLNKGQLEFEPSGEISQYEYQVTFSDGTEFSREFRTIDELKTINQQLISLVNHFNSTISES